MRSCGSGSIFANLTYPPPPDGVVVGADPLPFLRLEDAIKFVMEHIPPEQRGTAWITTDDGSLHIEEIERIYRTLPKEIVR
jgi:hypothetical protein